MKHERIKELGKGNFKRTTGVKRETFEGMLKTLKEAYAARHKKRGRHRKLSLEEMLLATLEYLYEYRTYECIGASYGLSRQNMHNTIKWVEGELVESGLFRLPGKRVLADNTEIEVIMVDTTETPIERPKKGQRRYYSGKKNGIR